MANLSALKKRAGMSMSGPPKMMNLGRDLGKNACNCIGKLSVYNTKPNGPSANAASTNAKGMSD